MGGYTPRRWHRVRAPGRQRTCYLLWPELQIVDIHGHMLIRGLIVVDIRDYCEVASAPCLLRQAEAIIP
jgi:hypothetical protein